MHEQSGWYADEAATFGDRLAAARRALGLREEEIARRLGVRVERLRAWEEDRAEPRTGRLQAIAALLAVSPAWLLTGEGEGPVPQSDRAGELVGALRRLRAQVERVAEPHRALELRPASLYGDGTV